MSAQSSQIASSFHTGYAALAEVTQPLLPMRASCRCCCSLHRPCAVHARSGEAPALLQDISRLPTFIQAGVKAVHADYVELDSATTQLDQTLPARKRQPETNRLPFDFLAICTGAARVQA